MKEGFNRRSSYLGENSFPHSQQGGCGPLSEAASPSLPPSPLVTAARRPRPCKCLDRPTVFLSLQSSVLLFVASLREERRGRWQATKQPGERGRTDGRPALHSAEPLGLGLRDRSGRPLSSVLGSAAALAGSKTTAAPPLPLRPLRALSLFLSISHSYRSSAEAESRLAGAAAAAQLDIQAARLAPPPPPAPADSKNTEL